MHRDFPLTQSAAHAFFQISLVNPLILISEKYFLQQNKSIINLNLKFITCNICMRDVIHASYCRERENNADQK